MLLDDKFGEGKVVVEDTRRSRVLVHVLRLGHRVWPMALAQDHKRAYDGDEGPNTGRHGRLPLPFITAEDERYAMEKSCSPSPTRDDRRGRPSRVLYGG